ncbi:hypothetical protein SLS59_008162 [Nothophoma quercina]|uniref:Sister chromatid cohesion acetyltransferase Eco1 n=1 Tax=Nothophoma quercina TaxID=749835 RepID=A0ABR3QTM8_9PLEO
MPVTSINKVRRTYSRQTKRPLYDEEPPPKRRRVEDAETEPTPSTTPTPRSPVGSLSPTRISSAPVSSSPPPSLPPSDAPTRSSPPSSPAPASSPPADARRRPIFSLFKRKLKHSVSAPEVLSERSHNAQSPPKPPLQSKKKRMVQMQLDLVGQHRKACKTCGMEYIPSNAEDVALHKKFHAVNFGGVDCTKAMVERLRQKQIWSGGEGSFIAVVGRRDAITLRNKASDVLKVVNTELAAVPISDEELWSQTTLSASTKASQEDTTTSEKCDRFKAYLHIRGQKCVAACLAERIQEAYTVLAQDETSEQSTQPLADSQSSSISVSTTADTVLLGISRIWVSNQFRKQGLARRLLDSTRSDFMYGLTVEKHLIAFSQPTESGGKLARKYFGREAGWHVYID